MVAFLLIVWIFDNQLVHFRFKEKALRKKIVFGNILVIVIVNNFIYLVVMSLIQSHFNFTLRNLPCSVVQCSLFVLLLSSVPQLYGMPYLNMLVGTKALILF